MTRLLGAVVLTAILASHGIPSVEAHGTSYVFADYDHVSGGWQAHGGIVTQYQHYKYVVTARMKSCSGSCAFSIDENGAIKYTGGGTVRTVAHTKTTCGTPSYSSLFGGYPCTALTTASTSTAPFCWAETVATVYSNATTVEVTKSWASSVNNCN